MLINSGEISREPLDTQRQENEVNRKRQPSQQGNSSLGQEIKQEIEEGLKETEFN